MTRPQTDLPVLSPLALRPGTVDSLALGRLAQGDLPYAVAAWVALTYRYLQQDEVTLLWHGPEPSARPMRFRLDAQLRGSGLLDLTRALLAQPGTSTHEPAAAPPLHLRVVQTDARPDAIAMAQYLPEGVACQLLWLRLPEGCEALLQYDPALQTDSPAAQMAVHLERLADGLLSAPQCALADLPMLSPQEQQTLRALGQGPAIETDAAPLYRVFEAQAALTPEATAVRFQAQSLSYGELNARANRLARCLRERGVTANRPVVSFFEPGLEVAIALLAIHKAGGIHVPMDPTHPAERITLLLDDVAPAAVLTLAYLCPRLPERALAPFCLDRDAALWQDLAADNLGLACDPAQTAYIVYTSGTTGKPKGVMASQANLSHYVQSARAAYGMGPGDRMPAMARFTFSITMFELWTPLVSGAELRLIPRADVLDFERLIDLLSEITFIHCAPSLMRNLLNYMAAQGVDSTRFARLRHASCGGDFVAFELLERMKQTFAAAEIFVIYGCTEIACMGCTSQAPRDRTLTRNSVGTPMANVGLRLLDAQAQAVPIGVKGEVCFWGPGINQGYWKQPELSAERFLERDGERYYRTGDWGRLDANGCLELLGRTDFQMKLRGMRMEPVEIESVLRQVPGVRDALVATRVLEGGSDKTLVAYLAFQAGAHPQLEEIRAFMQQRLPEYMLPALYLALDALPTNMNGKLDRAALPAPSASLMLRQGDAEAPQTPTERALAEVWSSVLNIRPVHRDSDFFALGGDSLSGVQMLLLAQERMGWELPMDAPVRAPSLREMAVLIDGGTSKADAGVVSLRAGNQKPALFCVYGVMLYRELSACLAPGRPVYGAYLANEVAWLAAQSPRAGQSVASVAGMARRYLELVRGIQPHGPYCLAGESFGGLIAMEMAQQLLACGETVSLLVMMDCHAPGSQFKAALPFGARVRLHLHHLRERGLAYVREKIERRRLIAREHAATRLLPWLQRLNLGVPRKLLEVAGQAHQRRASHAASDAYHPRSYAGRVLLCRASERNAFEVDERHDLGWGALLAQLSVEHVPGDHLGILRAPHVQTLAAVLDRHLDAATRG